MGFVPVIPWCAVKAPIPAVLHRERQVDTCDEQNCLLCALKRMPVLQGQCNSTRCGCAEIILRNSMITLEYLDKWLSGVDKILTGILRLTGGAGKSKQEGNLPSCVLR